MEIIITESNLFFFLVTVILLTSWEIGNAIAHEGNYSEIF